MQEMNMVECQFVSGDWGKNLCPHPRLPLPPGAQNQPTYLHADVSRDTSAQNNSKNFTVAAGDWGKKEIDMLSEIGVALGLCCLDFDVYSCKPCTAGLHF